MRSEISWQGLEQDHRGHVSAIGPFPIHQAQVRPQARYRHSGVSDDVFPGAGSDLRDYGNTFQDQRIAALVFSPAEGSCIC